MTYKSYGCLDAYNTIVGNLSENSDFKESLKHLSQTGNDYLVYLGTLDAPTDSDIMKQVIGRNGCYFIRTTQECDLDFIWHNRDTNKIEFWGPRENLTYGINAIEYRIKKITKTQLETKCLDQVANKMDLGEVNNGECNTED